MEDQEQNQDQMLEQSPEPISEKIQEGSVDTGSNEEEVVIKRSPLAVLFEGRGMKRLFERGNRFFLYYVCFLLLCSITLSIAIDSVRLRQVQGSRELVNLKAEYRSRKSRLQFASKREEIYSRLKALESKVEPPHRPAYHVVIDE